MKPDYNLATVSAEAIAGICHRVAALQIVGSDFAPPMARELDARFRDLAKRLGYDVAPPKVPPPSGRTYEDGIRKAIALLSQWADEAEDRANENTDRYRGAMAHLEASAHREAAEKLEKLLTQEVPA